MALKVLQEISGSEVKEVVHIRRGDSGVLTVTVKDEEGTPYEIEDGDLFILTVRKQASDGSDVVFSTTSPIGEFQINPEDTNGAEPGKYSFDIQLNRDGGDIETVYPHVGDPLYESKRWGNFCIEPEVTIHGQS